jgi:single-stranded-DNA-specific exonuclease
VETFSSASAPWGTFERLTRAQFAEFHQAGIASLHAQLLFNRNIRTPTEMHAFLAASLDQLLDPHLLIDMDRALSRIQRALSTHERITVYGDFDADGVTSAALVTRVLRRLGQPEALLSYFIPSRIQGTRGLYKEAIDTLLADGTSLIITTDCGSSDVEEVAYAQGLGLDVIITDHHHPPTQLPQATAMLNPWRPDCTYNERYLCGVGIAFKLAQALFQAYGYTSDELRPLLDLVAIGTVGDVAALLGENHALVRAGMQQLNQTENLGLQALIQLSKLQPGRIRERDISFALAPRINAAGRMAEADLAFELLTTSDSSEAARLATELEDLNLKRQTQTEELMKLVREQAQLQADKQVVLVSGEKEFWPEGIIGLVAGKLSEEIQRPVFVLSQDTEFSRGSARCQENFNIILALRAARPAIFERYGGHAQAAGFTIANANITELHEHLLRCWLEQAQSSNDGNAVEGPAENVENLASLGLEPEPAATTLSRKVDFVITKPEALDMDTLYKINQLSPFGSNNPEPVFRIDSIQLARHWTSGQDGRHLRVRLRSNGLLFNGTLLRGGARAGALKDGSLVQVIFSLEQAWSPPDSEVRQEVWFKILDITPLQQA